MLTPPDRERTLPHAPVGPELRGARQVSDGVKSLWGSMVSPAQCSIETHASSDGQIDLAFGMCAAARVVKIELVRTETCAQFRRRHRPNGGTGAYRPWCGCLRLLIFNLHHSLPGRPFYALAVDDGRRRHQDAPGPVPVSQNQIVIEILEDAIIASRPGGRGAGKRGSTKSHSLTAEPCS